VVDCCELAYNLKYVRIPKKEGYIDFDNDKEKNAQVEK
jgi:hypothetical protein